MKQMNRKSWPLRLPGFASRAAAVMAAALCAGGFLSPRASGAARPPDAADLVEVKRGTLEDLVKGEGHLEAANSVIIRAPYVPVRGRRTKVMKLVPEGTQVKPGDFLVDLDKEGMDQRERRQLADVERAKAELADAEETLRGERARLKTEVERTEKDHAIARSQQDLVLAKPYYMDRLKAEVAQQQAKMAVAHARAAHQTAATLAAKGHRTQQDAELKKLDLDLALIELKRREIERRVVLAGAPQLERRRAELRVARARTLSERAKVNMEWRLKQLEAHVVGARADLEMEQKDLKRLRRIRKGLTITAKTSGVVVYGKTSGHGGLGKIKEGAEVWQHMKLLSIPDTSRMLLKVDVEEPYFSRVSRGQPAKVFVGALGGAEFPARVHGVGRVFREKGEDESKPWLGKGEPTGTKIFHVTLEILKSDKRLEPGLNGRAHIQTRVRKDVLHLPHTAVFSAGTKHYVYRLDAGRLVQRTVTVGDTIGGRIEIRTGLKEGDEISLTPPE